MLNEQTADNQRIKKSTKQGEGNVNEESRHFLTPALQRYNTPSPPVNDKKTSSSLVLSSLAIILR